MRPKLKKGNRTVSPLKVLLVVYAFPPAAGVGVLRAASLARYFPAEGIRLDVLTARNPSSVGVDPSLLEVIPADVNIHRITTLDIPFGIKKRLKRLFTSSKPPDSQADSTAKAGKPSFLKRALQDLLLPDPQVVWLPALTRAARRIVKDREIDLVLITGAPFSSFLLTERLRKEFPRRAIVLDFRDEWLATQLEIGGFPFSGSKRARSFAVRAESRVVASATAVVAVTENARHAMRGRYPQEPDDKFQLISNGFDATRLHRSATSRERTPGSKIVVTHIGTVYPSTDPTTLIEAVQTLPPELKSRFALRFIGHIEEPRYRNALLQLGDMVELRGFLPQHEALAAMDESDYVLLIQHNRFNVAAKFYDYIGGGKPILAAVHPQSDERRMLEELRAGWWAGNRDVKGIRQLFVDAAARVDSLHSTFQPDAEKIAQYERKVLAHRYAELLHSIAGSQSQYDSPTTTVQLAGTGE
jgi:glycosyltransferase involved in cell wall biosynthesis